MRISLVRKLYYTCIIVSHIVLSMLQLTDGTIQTNDHTITFVEDVAVIWHVNIPKKTIVFRIRSSSNQYRSVYGITYVYLSIIVRVSFECRVNENVNGTV